MKKKETKEPLFQVLFRERLPELTAEQKLQLAQEVDAKLAVSGAYAKQEIRILASRVFADKPANSLDMSPDDYAKLVKKGVLR
jgi:hypothetical protein